SSDSSLKDLRFTLRVCRSRFSVCLTRCCSFDCSDCRSVTEVVLRRDCAQPSSVPTHSSVPTAMQSRVRVHSRLLLRLNNFVTIGHIKWGSQDALRQYCRFMLQL